MIRRTTAFLLICICLLGIVFSVRQLFAVSLLFVAKQDSELQTVRSEAVKQSYLLAPWNAETRRVLLRDARLTQEYDVALALSASNLHWLPAWPYAWLDLSRSAALSQKSVVEQLPFVLTAYRYGSSERRVLVRVVELGIREWYRLDSPSQEQVKVVLGRLMGGPSRDAFLAIDRPRQLQQRLCRLTARYHPELSC